MKKRYYSFCNKWLPCGLFAAFVFFFSLSLQAQSAPVKLWDKTFGGSGMDFFYSLQQTSDGGYILGGYSDSGISGDKSQPSQGSYSRDYWVVKIDANGNKLWDKTFGGGLTDELHSLRQTSDGGYILGGYSQSGSNGDKSQVSKGGKDYWVVKIDANGKKLWDKTFGGSSEDELYSLQQTSDGGYILGGYSMSGNSGDKTQASRGNYDFWIVKLDANGSKLWDKTIGGNYEDKLYSLQQTSDGGYILGGGSMSGISGDKTQASKNWSDYWVVKLDASGNKLWDKTIGGDEDDYLRSLQQTTDGGYILGGWSDSGISGDKSQASKGSDDYWVVKLDANGNKLWDKTIGGSSWDYCYSLQQTTDGGYILGGWSYSGISGDKTQVSQGRADFWAVKLDAQGNIEWDRTFGGNELDNIFSLQQTSDGGYILGGQSHSDIGGDKSQSSKYNWDYWVVKLGIPCDVVPTVMSGSNCGSGTVTLSAYGAPSGSSYVWYSDSTGGSSIYSSSSGVFTTPVLNTTTTFYVGVVNNAGCEGPRVAVTATIQLEPQVSLGNDIEDCEGNEIWLKPQGTSGAYLWSDGSKDSSMIVRRSGRYWVQISKNGCVATDTIQVTFKSCFSTLLPNIITPNNDNLNETFKITALPSGRWQLKIFNRWGVKLFESEDYQNNWPDKKISDGTYYYLLRNSETGQQYKGWVEVVQ